MGFLGVVVLTFGFQIFSQRALLRRHRLGVGLGLGLGLGLEPTRAAPQAR